VNKFILRRTNDLLSDHLPPKLVQVVCCRLTPLQQQLYKHFLHSKSVQHLLSGRHSKVLSSIGALKKLCNHPKLIYDAVYAIHAVSVPCLHLPHVCVSLFGGSHSYAGNSAHGFEDCDRFFPPNFRRCKGALPEMSGKFDVLSRMLNMMRATTQDRIVLVSNYTQTLDLMATMLRGMGFPYLRLDGSTSAAKRQRLVDMFNDFSQDQFAFLLSSKAGGCGLNLVGGNRLILFDPDWNVSHRLAAAWVF